MADRSRLGIGKVLISLAAVATAVGPYKYDWNETHIYNPAWPPHAKFHNAQTMSLGAALSLVSLYQLWRPTDAPRAALGNAATASSLYWLTQITAGFYPGAAGVDPPDVDTWPQLKFALPILSLVALGYLLERHRVDVTGTPARSVAP